MSGSSSGATPGDAGDDDDGDRSDPTADRDRSDSDAGRSSHRSDEEATAASDAVTIDDDGVLRWFLKTQDESVVMVRDVLSSVALVGVVALLLFGISGIWPPLVAVESGSMEPQTHRGDLIFVVDENRYVGDGAVAGTGVVTVEGGEESGYEEFGNPGDVIVFRPDGSERRTPVIHRAHFWVEEGDEWVETKADPSVTGGATCEEVSTCPAPYDGFITKGDNNRGYDQHIGGADTNVVKPEWITGKAKFRVPWLGHVRLTVDRLLGGMLVPTSPASQPLQQPAEPAMTVAAAGPDAAESGFGSELAGVAGIAGFAGGGAVLAAGRYRS